MKLYLKDQGFRFGEHLKQLKSFSISSYRISCLREKVSQVVIDVPFSVCCEVQTVTSDYTIFPGNILQAFCQWKHENRAMQVGDVIVQQAYLPPSSFCSVKTIMGVRISEIISEPGQIGFRYETLEGHVERGISTFTLEERGNKTVFRIHTFSKAANSLIGFIARPYQRFCTLQALKNVKRHIEGYTE